MPQEEDMDLIGKIKSKAAKPCVIGLGYVGLPLAVEFSRSGFCVTGIDVDKAKVNSINRGISYIQDVDSKVLGELVREGRLKATGDFEALKEVDTINICVPTPLRKTKEPDISYIVAAAEEIARHLRKGQLVILESTTYPGTTEEVILPMLEATGLEVGRDFFLAFSPERIDPGNREFTTKNIPKVVGGITKECTRAACALYEQSIEKVIPVSSTQAAEMVKLLENTFRSVNIGLVNEMALMSTKLGVDVWEIIDAASTKPFGFMPFYPGPGLGGHCIPIDPLFLSWKAKLNGFEPRFIELASEINRLMPEHVVSRVADALNERQKCVRGSKILILGVSYKRDVSDTRESPAHDIIKQLKAKGAEVLYNDPYVPSLKLEEISLRSANLADELLRSIDCAVVVTDHSSYNYLWILANTKLLIDTRNATRGITNGKEKIVKI